MDKIKIAVVGVGGGMGRTRLKFLLTNSKVEVVGICDKLDKAKQLAEQYGLSLITNYEELLIRKDIDAVTLSIPNNLHFPYTLKALEAGKHVLVEYPMANKVEEAARLAQFAKEKRLILHPGHTMRFEPVHKVFKENLPSIGRLIFTTLFLWYGSGSPIGNWYGDPEARGDSFTFLCYHHIDQFRDLFGEVAWVDGVLDDKIVSEGRFGRTSGTLMLGFVNGGCAFTTQGHGLLAPNNVNFCLVGENGYLESTPGENIYDYNKYKISLVTRNGKEQLTLPSGDPYQEDTGNFIKEILGEMEIKVPSEEAVKTIEVCNAAARSAQQGKRNFLSGGNNG